MAALKHLPQDISPDAIVEAIQTDGGVIIDKLMSAEKLEAVKRDLEPFLSVGVFSDNDFAGLKTKRIGSLMARCPATRELALHPIITPAAKKYLAPFCDGIQLHLTQCVSIGPGESGQFLHRDRGVWGTYVDNAIETQFSSIWAVTDFTFENGATQVVPGSHLWDEDRIPQEHEITYAEMQAGSAFFYNGSVLHGGGGNQTNEFRTAVLLHYTLNWLRQQENQYLSCPQEAAKDLSPELRSLMGYSKGGPVLGFCSTPTPAGEGMDRIDPEALFT